MPSCCHITFRFRHNHASCPTCSPSCSPWWMASRSRPAGRPSDYSPARLSEPRRNNQARRAAGCPSSASPGTAARTRSIAWAGDQIRPPGSYLGVKTERRGEGLKTWKWQCMGGGVAHGCWTCPRARRWALKTQRCCTSVCKESWELQ